MKEITLNIAADIPPAKITEFTEIVAEMMVAETERVARRSELMAAQKATRAADQRSCDLQERMSEFLASLVVVEDAA